MLRKFLNYTRNLSKFIIVASMFIIKPALACLTCPVSTGVENLQLKNDIRVIIEPNIDPECVKKSNLGEDVLCFPHSKMTFIKGKIRKDLTYLISKWDEFHMYFVKVRKGKYLADLNNDGKPEIAILPMLSGGGEWVLTAYLYTVTENGLEYFGEGKFFWENGEFVQLGCPQCGKFNLEQCKSCY